MSPENFRTLALSFPGTEETPHFDRAAFKIVGERIFATLHEKSESANLALSPSEQIAFCKYEKKFVYPIPNKWGERGWTTFELPHISRELMLSALESAYHDVLNSKNKRRNP